MSIDLSTYLNQTATLTKKGGVDLYGKPTNGTDSTVDVRFQSSTKRLHDVKGEEIVADAEVWTKPDVDIALNDFIVFESVKYKVVRVDTKRDFDGTKHHKKAFVVRVS